MRLRNRIELENTREKLRGLEALYADRDQAPVDDPLARELMLKSLKRLMDQMREEIDEFEAETLAQRV